MGAGIWKQPQGVPVGSFDLTASNLIVDDENTEIQVVVFAQSVTVHNLPSGAYGLSFYCKGCTSLTVPASATLSSVSMDGMPNLTQLPSFADWQCANYGLYGMSLGTLDRNKFPYSTINGAGINIEASECGITSLANFATAGGTTAIAYLNLYGNQVPKAQLIAILSDIADHYYFPDGGSLDFSGPGMPTFTPQEVTSYVQPVRNRDYSVTINE